MNDSYAVGLLLLSALCPLLPLMKPSGMGLPDLGPRADGLGCLDGRAVREAVAGSSKKCLNFCKCECFENNSDVYSP